MQGSLLKVIIRILVVASAALLAMWAADGPVQPLPFSHKDHAGTLKLQCKMCHPSPDPGESMTIAPPSVCMQCHSAIKADSPAIQKLAQVQIRAVGAHLRDSRMGRFQPSRAPRSR